MRGRHLAEHPHHQDDQQAGHRVAEERGGAGLVDHHAGADEQPGADDAADRDHRQVPLLEPFCSPGVRLGLRSGWQAWTATWGLLTAGISGPRRPLTKTPTRCAPALNPGGQPSSSRSSARRRSSQRAEMPRISSLTKRRNSRVTQQPPVRRIGVTDALDRGVEGGEHRPVGLVLAHHRLVPRVVVDDVHVAAGAALALAPQHPDPRQVVHRPRDAGRADPERVGELGGGHPAVVVDEQRREHPRRQPGEPGVGERAGHPLDEALALGRVGHARDLTRFRKF